MDGLCFFSSAGSETYEEAAAMEGAPSLSAFDGCPRGGCFYPTIVDHGEHGGTLALWSVYIEKPADSIAS